MLSVTITSPATGSSVRAGESVVINAVAKDSDTANTITKVELWVNGVLHSQVTEAPYVFNWVPPSNGVYSLTAMVHNDVPDTLLSSALSLTALGTVIVPEDNLSMTVNDLSACQSYSYRARFKNLDGDGPWTDWGSVEAGQAVPSIAPGGFIEFFNGTSVAIHYRPADNNSQVEYKVGVGGTWTAATTNPIVLPVSVGDTNVYFRGVNTAGTGTEGVLALTWPSPPPVEGDPNNQFWLQVQTAADLSNFTLHKYGNAVEDLAFVDDAGIPAVKIKSLNTDQRAFLQFLTPPDAEDVDIMIYGRVNVARTNRHNGPVARASITQVDGYMSSWIADTSVRVRRVSDGSFNLTASDVVTGISSTQYNWLALKTVGDTIELTQWSGLASDRPATPTIATTGGNMLSGNRPMGVLTSGNLNDEVYISTISVGINGLPAPSGPIIGGGGGTPSVIRRPLIWMTH